MTGLDATRPLPAPRATALGRAGTGTDVATGSDIGPPGPPVDAVVSDEVLEARAAWARVVRAGECLRIVDLGGNQAVDCLLYRASDTVERYSAADTIVAQGNILLRSGSVLLSTEGNSMMTVTATTCAFHDTIGGACSRESNTLRYGHHTLHQHACVDNFLDAGARVGLGRRDLAGNINWFMNVPVGPEGTLGIVDGISAPGLHVDLRAEMDVLVLISNCPQINNPCNGFDPTPVRLTVFRPAAAAGGRP
jgi:urea carboxylase-associated protein 1